jgi:hypothetical protein
MPLVGINVSEEHIASIIRVTRIRAELTNLLTLMMEMIHSSETSVLRGATRRHILEHGSLHSQRRETWNLPFK